MSSESGQYDYEAELDDDSDGITFGKFKGLTPVQLASTEKGRAYIMWAHRNTRYWLGSQELVMRVFKIEGMEYKPRPEPVVKPAVEGNIVEQFEAAVLDAYGVFPKPIWMW